MRQKEGFESDCLGSNSSSVQITGPLCLTAFICKAGRTMVPARQADVMNVLGQRAMAEDSWGLSPLGHSEHVSGARGRWREEVRTIWRSGKIL